MSQDSMNNSDISFNIIPKKTVEKTVPFWSQNPNVILQSEYIFEFFPVDSMSLSQSLNSISRTVIFLSIIGFIITKDVNFMIVLGITLFAIYFYFKSQTKGEGFENPGLAIINDFSYNKASTSLKDVFDKSNSQNPFSNVMIPDYKYNPNKKPAPPAYSSDINNEILANAKKTVAELNPDQPDITDKLFKDLGEQLEFEQSMRNFYSTANTSIPNDQAAFAEFCYGSMISCKEGNLFACARNLDRYTN